MPNVIGICDKLTRLSRPLDLSLDPVKLHDRIHRELMAFNVGILMAKKHLLHMIDRLFARRIGTVA